MEETIDIRAINEKIERESAFVDLLMLEMNKVIVGQKHMEVTIDEDLLKMIATTTGGKYFRATNSKKLAAIYEEINKLEKTEIEEFRYTNYEEKFRIFVLFAGLLLLLEIILRKTLFRSFI